MRYFIGDKSCFAIEYSINSLLSKDGYLYGNFRLWICNDYIGYFDEDEYLSHFQNEMNRLAERYEKLQNSLLYKMNAEELISFLKKQKETIEGYDEDLNIDRYIFGRSRTFDDFCTLCLYDEASLKLKFIWKIDEQTNYEYPDYPREAFSSEVDLDVFKSVASAFYNL
jgi:hypothetical protein